MLQLQLVVQRWIQMHFGQDELSLQCLRLCSIDAFGLIKLSDCELHGSTTQRSVAHLL